MSYQSGELGPDHRVDSFDCGKDDLNTWLTRNARRAQRAGTARVYVWTHADDPTGTVVAYFALCPTEVVRDDDGLSRGMAGGHSRIPGYLMARLAVDRTLHGQGVGGQLILDAMTRIVAAAAIGGGRIVVVDAIDDDAARFYRRFGFVPVRHRPLRLVLKVSDARSHVAP